MIVNLPESFLYERLPEALVELDERGIIQAVVGGIQDRIEDLRAYSKKLQYLFQPLGLPETGHNVVLADLQSGQGKVYTRSLDLQTDTPPDGSEALLDWVRAQLVTVPPEHIFNVRYGRDLLRLVDINTLDYLAQTIGAILYQSSALAAGEEQKLAEQQLVSTYFARLKIKGTAESFEVLGRILGFDDIIMTPLWGRLSPRIPNDIGNGSNTPDFNSEPEYYPQQEIGPVYNPHIQDDGPYYGWQGTADPGTASTQFYTQVINGFNPWVEVEVKAVQYGTIVPPPAGVYVLGSAGTETEGGPHKKAWVEPPGSTIVFRAISEGASFNGLEIQVAEAGTRQQISIQDRLSAIKYRTSYFDLSLAAEFDRVEELYGDQAVRRNQDLVENPNLHQVPDGTALTPYRPWSAGSLTTGLEARDFLVETKAGDPVVITARVQSSGTNRELNMDEFLAAGAQVTQALEEVRAATRLERRSSTGFLIRDQAGYAAFGSPTLLFTTNYNVGYTGATAEHPLSPYIAEIVLQFGETHVSMTASQDPANPDLFYYRSEGVSGHFDFVHGTYAFTFVSVQPGTQVFALWQPTSTEVIRPEPAAPPKAYQVRPEDQENGRLDELADDVPWARRLIVSGEEVDWLLYNPLVPDRYVQEVDNLMAIPAQTGAEYNLYGIPSVTGRPRLTTEARPTDRDYRPGAPAIGYAGVIRDLAAVVETPGQTELEKLLEPGAKLYTLGLVQGVLVADPNKFFGPAHRDGLVGWFPFNEHPEDHLPPQDRSSRATPLTPWNVQSTDRLWSDELGWYLRLPKEATLTSEKLRFTGPDFSMSFWINPAVSASGAVTTLFEYGPVSLDYDSGSGGLRGYVRDLNWSRTPVATVFPVGWTFVCLRLSATQAIMGTGTAHSPVLDATLLGDFKAFGEDAETLVIQGCGVLLGLGDLRLWSQFKTLAECNAIRNYEPTPTQVGWPPGSFLSVNRRDRYAVKILPNGRGAPALLPAGFTVPKLAWVQRYDSLGLYAGERRFNQTGLGGGQLLPVTYRLGQQFYNVTATARTVVSNMPGALPTSAAAVPFIALQSDNGSWYNLRAVQLVPTVAVLDVEQLPTAPGTIPRLILRNESDGLLYRFQLYTSGGYTGWEIVNTPTAEPETVVVFLVSGSLYQLGLVYDGGLTYQLRYIPPTTVSATDLNPNREEIWLLGQNGYIYECQLESTGPAARLVADFIARSRTDAELLLSGPETPAWPTLRYSEQPTGARVAIAADNKAITVLPDGETVVVAPLSGEATLPQYLYLNSQIEAEVPNAWEAWTEKDDTGQFGNQQVPPVAALDENDLLEFTNLGTLEPGNYKLTVISGNIGQVDRDFDGFAVDIAVDATLFSRRLCQGLTGFNFTGTDSFEFAAESGVTGEWLLSFRWTNHFADARSGVARQLVIYGYRLERLVTELYRISIPPTGTEPVVTPLSTDVYNPNVPGGWLATLNSLGEVVAWEHEAKVYPTADTLTVKYPLSHLLTGSTQERREDVQGPLNIVLTDPPPLALPPLGTIIDGATPQTPIYLWAGAVTGDSVTIAARLPADSAVVQVAVSTSPALISPIFSPMAAAHAGNSNVAKIRMTGLTPNTHYYYAIALGGVINSSYIGQFSTWDETRLNFSFGLASCSLNTITAGINPTVYDKIRAKNPLFFLHMGDLHYNDLAQEPTTLAQFQNCYDKVFELSARQKLMWQEMPVIYMWDDHDYGPNDSYGDYANKALSRTGFQRGVPHYPLAAGAGNIPLYFTFVVGRCLFIVTDLRSECDPSSKPDGPDKTRMGAAQKAWFKNQLLAARDVHPIIFWLSSVPWGQAPAVVDGWAGWSYERRELADFILANHVRGVFILSGDMHACATDDGRNMRWGTGNTGGLAVIQAGPLHQNASRKGEPYQVGPFPASGAALKNQYGIITVTDDGVGVPSVRFVARDDTAGTDLVLIDVTYAATYADGIPFWVDDPVDDELPLFAQPPEPGGEEEPFNSQE